MSSLLTEKLSRPDTTLVHSLSLCHIAVFLFLAIYDHLDKAGSGVETFSTIAHSLTRKLQEYQAEEPELDAKTTMSQLAYGCLYIMDTEDLQYTPDEYDLWREAVLHAGRTSFPDELVEVLGRFIPHGEGRWLYRLQEYRDRIRSRSASPDLQPALDGVCSVEQNVDM